VIRGGLGSGQALVPASPVPDWATWSSGGPVSHGSNFTQVDIEPHFSYPGGGQANDYEGDPSPEWPGKPYGFTANGVMSLGTITSRSLQGFGDASASTGIATLPPMHVTANVVSSIGPTVTAAIGAGFGAALAPQHRATGTLVGALVGGILGLIFSPG
jgi:hypothetical protein